MIPCVSPPSSGELYQQQRLSHKYFMKMSPIINSLNSFYRLKEPHIRFTISLAFDLWKHTHKNFQNFNNKQIKGFNLLASV